MESDFHLSTIPGLDNLRLNEQRSGVSAGRQTRTRRIDLQGERIGLGVVLVFPKDAHGKNRKTGARRKGAERVVKPLETSSIDFTRHACHGNDGGRVAGVVSAVAPAK